MDFSVDGYPTSPIYSDVPMKQPPLTEDFPIQTSMYRGFSILSKLWFTTVRTFNWKWWLCLAMFAGRWVSEVWTSIFLLKKYTTAFHAFGDCLSSSMGYFHVHLRIRCWSCAGFFDAVIADLPDAWHAGKHRSAWGISGFHCVMSFDMMVRLRDIFLSTYINITFFQVDELKSIA